MDLGAYLKQHFRTEQNEKAKRFKTSSQEDGTPACSPRALFQLAPSPPSADMKRAASSLGLSTEAEEEEEAAWQSQAMLPETPDLKSRWATFGRDSQDCASSSAPQKRPLSPPSQKQPMEESPKEKQGPSQETSSSASCPNMAHGPKAVPPHAPISSSSQPAGAILGPLAGEPPASSSAMGDERATGSPPWQSHVLGAPGSEEPEGKSLLDSSKEGQEDAEDGEEEAQLEEDLLERGDEETQLEEEGNPTGTELEGDKPGACEELAGEEEVLRRPAARKAAPKAKATIKRPAMAKAAMKRPARAKATAHAEAAHEGEFDIPSHGFMWKDGGCWAGARFPKKHAQAEVFRQKISVYSAMCDWVLTEVKDFRHSEKLAREFNDHLQAAKKTAGEELQWTNMPTAELQEFLSQAAMQFAAKKWPALQESIDRTTAMHESNGKEP